MKTSHVNHLTTEMTEIVVRHLSKNYFSFAKTRDIPDEIRSGKFRPRRILIRFLKNMYRICTVMEGMLVTVRKPRKRASLLGNGKLFRIYDHVQ